MKKLLCILSLLMLSALAFGQTGLPPCDPNYTSPNCTDYFGVANWAQSPLPAGTITGFTVKASGSGYSSPSSLVFTMTDVNLAAPVTFTVTATLNASGGLATVTGTGPANSIAPQITVTDMGPGWLSGPATCGGPNQPACGSGAVVLATIGAPLTPGTGIRKFQDTLTLPFANLAIAIPDTTTFPGSDYYVIGLQEYTAKMHTDLPPTRLRGYCQINNPAAPGVCTPSYLGPTIIAVKNRPVRVLFKNLLPTGTGGNLFIPVDTTYMGAGAPYTQNRATLHLHGGATPWISDGTPHQWTTPAGETGPARGASVQFVPDMWFDTAANGYAFITACAGKPNCPSVPAATNDPGPGNLTFFWTNQQGGRLMFYHDHAYGITRLNVYAGEAAGYLLGDPQEEDALAAATVPGTVGAAVGGTTPADVMHLVPMVIQDKTFVPSAAEVAAEDPTWTGGGFGTNPGFVNLGDLWFPHVYTTNQNPADPGGANAFGRWDYGPWTLPGNQTVLLAANPETAVTIPCTSTAFPNQMVQCPITPNPSGTPEGFMDTPLVNGKAYPVLHVAPEAYRFRILSAGNDRSWNLSWYVADPTVTTVDGRLNTEVKMLPSVQPTGAAGTLPLCTQITPITNTTLFMGLATGLLDSTGAPLNGTGLPAGCWPNFGAGSQTAGIPVQQTMWAADGRAGGVPDPTTAGPAWIEIGTEGGLLPAPVVIPSMPIGYEANTRSVTITNVSVHGLWLGPAERADAVVDFSKFGGKTLILYNDAPTPAPAVDSRLDYFTGDGDQTPIGGAPNTIAGFGPNTRTIMQVIVDQPTTAKPFSLSTLTNALPGIFAQTQPPPIVPEPTYPPASGGYSPILTYSLISDATLTWIPIGQTTPVTYTDERKTIQELFTLDYGRMNATLGVELPLTNFLTQTTIPLGYIDPITEVMMSGPVYPATSVPLKSANDNTQLWHITHNGVDTHFIHFHLFNVQVINRSGWDGTVRPIDQNELGWKDTVRMNPLEDILVAIQPIQPAPPFPVPDSYRLLDVTMPAGSDCPAPAPGPAPPPCSIFTDVNPASNNPQNTPNKVQDFGWEYVWHCHILGHEENDMMRAIAFNVPPEAPSSLAVAPATTGLNLTWTDNSASETGFTLQRDVTASFAAPSNVASVPPLNPDANGQGTTYGGTLTFNDTGATGTGPYFYRVQAFKPLASYWSSGTVTSAWSNTASFGGTTSVTPTALAFGSVAVTTPATTSAAQTVTLSNAGATAITYTLSIVPAGQFAVVDDPSCIGTVAAGASCNFSVTFTPTVGGAQSASLIIGTGDPANPSFTVSLTGTGGTALPLLTITANNTTMKYGSALPPLTFSYSPANPAGLTTPASCITTATSTSPVGTYRITCSGAVDANYTITYVAGTLTVTPVPLTIWGPNVTMFFGGTVPTITPLYTGFVAGDNAGTLVVAPNAAPTCNAYVTPPAPPAPGTLVTSITPVGKYTTVCSGAVDSNYSPINYVAGIFTVSPALLTITPAPLTLPYNTPIPSTFTLNATGLVGADTLASLGMAQPPITCTTTASTVAPQPPTVGSYPITCTGPAQAPPTGTATYTVTYAPGLLTVSIVTPTVTFTGAPASSGYQSTFNVTATTNALGAVAPTITATGVCTVGAVTGTSPATAIVTMTSGTGTCTLSANWAAIPPNYTAASATQSTTATTIAPTVTFTGAPATAPYQGTFTVATTTTASTVAVITASGVCSIAGNTVTMTSGTGTCTLTANWAADPNYSAATATQTTAASTIAPTVTFTGAPATANYLSTFTVATTTNATTAAVITASGACSIVGNLVTMTSGTGTCTLTANWAADANYSAATATQSTLAAQIAPTVTFTGAPATAPYLGTFTVATTTNASTTAVIAATGVCSIAGNVVTMTSGTGTCSLTASWGADANYLAATATQSTTATLAAPTVTFTGAPANAPYLGTFAVATTTNATTTAVITATGVCSITGNTITMTSGTGTCSLTASWAADTNYAAATATQSTTATKIAPTVTFTGAPASAPYQGTFTVATTTNATTAAVITASGGCSILGNLVTMTSGTTTCSLAANWAADANYNAATLTQSTLATKIAPTVTFTAPASAVYNTSFTVTATSNSSSLALITSSGGCSNVGPLVTMTSGTTACSLTANWAADANYVAAGPLTQTTAAAKAASTTAIVSNLPNPSIVGQVVTVTLSVTGTTVPTGLVTVNASTGQTCSGTFPGTTSCTLTFPLSGKPTLTANYAGDTNFNPSSSAAVTQVVSQVSLSASTLLFGNQLVGTTSASQFVSLTNVGTTPLGITSIVYTGPFRDSTNCPIGGFLNAGSSCRFGVRFSPVAPGVATGTVVVTTSDAASPATITLTGTGTLPPLNLTPVSWNYGGVTSGTTSAPQTFTLTNGTAAPVTVSRVMLNGANPGQFAIQGTTCITTLPVGGTCTINVVFSPTAPGAYTANVTIRDNVNGPAPSSALSGTGL